MARLTFRTLKDSGIQKLHSNGGRKQEIIWKTSEGKKFRVLIKSESYEFQSYGKLYAWDDLENEWNIISSINPVKDYQIDISYSSNYSERAFDPIIKEFKKLAKEF